VSCQVEGETGIAVTSDVVFPNPPLIIELEPAGRVDLVSGIPPPWLTPRILDGLELVDIQSAPHTMIRVVAGLLRRAASPSARPAVMSSHLASGLLPSVRAAQRHTPQDIPPQTLTELSMSEHGRIVRRARRAEGLSVLDVVKRCRALPGTSGATTVDRVRGLEAGSAALPDVVGELNVALGLGGRLGPCTVASGADALRVMFPRAYVGPVWLELDPASGNQDQVKLSWAGFQKQLRPVQGARVWFTKSWPSAAPLTVRANGWRLRAGVGRAPGAHDVHAGWSVDYEAWMDEIRQGVDQFVRGRGNRRGD
jgi:hypothetical protein